MNKTETYRPLIKYTGGKYDEYKFFKNEIPEKINDYFEPFFGGGGVFFQLNNEDRINGKGFVNDVSSDLIDFYKNVTSPKFVSYVKEIADVWEDVKQVAEEISNKFNDLFFDVILGNKDIKDFINSNLSNEIEQCISNTEHLKDYNTHGFSVIKKMFNGLEDKTKRFIKKDISSDETDLPYKSITTSIHQAFYFIVRDMYNDWLCGNEGYESEEKSAQWFFIREFCYGSMFRFSRDGKFNIPYGGFGYNSKCFKCKVDEVCSDKVQKLLSKTSLNNQDFSAFLNRNFNSDDFIFLDPPYDSTFSEYDNNSFTREDQKRLKECMDKVQAKWMLVIKKTDFISELYKEYTQIPFDKTYSYHARGTYDDKNCTHLIIKNF